MPKLQSIGLLRLQSSCLRNSAECRCLDLSEDTIAFVLATQAATKVTQPRTKGWLDITDQDSLIAFRGADDSYGHSGPEWVMACPCAVLGKQVLSPAAVSETPKEVGLFYETTSGGALALLMPNTWTSTAQSASD